MRPGCLILPLAGVLLLAQWSSLRAANHPADCLVTDCKPPGSFRQLVWAVSPVPDDNLENTAVQEPQVIPAN